MPGEIASEQIPSASLAQRFAKVTEKLRKVLDHTTVANGLAEVLQIQHRRVQEITI
jgi:hypothetical protein